jgi:hypothetical protein
MCGPVADSHGRKVSRGTHVRDLIYVVDLRLTVCCGGMSPVIKPWMYDVLYKELPSMCGP